MGIRYATADERRQWHRDPDAPVLDDYINQIYGE